MAPLHGLDTIFGAFQAAGLSEHDAFGNEGPLSWPTLDAFARLTRHISEPWEAEVLRSMSLAYVTGKISGKNPLSISPIDQ